MHMNINLNTHPYTYTDIDDTSATHVHSYPYIYSNQQHQNFNTSYIQQNQYPYQYQNMISIQQQLEKQKELHKHLNQLNEYQISNLKNFENEKINYESNTKIARARDNSADQSQSQSQSQNPGQNQSQNQNQYIINTVKSQTPIPMQYRPMYINKESIYSSVNQFKPAFPSNDFFKEDTQLLNTFLPTPTTPPSVNEDNNIPDTPQPDKFSNNYINSKSLIHRDIVHRFKNSKYMQNLKTNSLNDDEFDAFVTWRKKDDVLLKYLRIEEGLSWKSIAKFFPGRTVSACQCRLKRLNKRESKKPPLQH